MKKLSLQWRLTLLNAVLLALCCLVLYLFISNSALMKFDEIESTVMSIELTGSDDMILMGVENLFPSLYESLQSTRSAFQIQCLIVTIIVILIGSGLTWIVSGIVLKPLKQFSRRIDELSVNDLAEPLPTPDSKDEIAELTISFNRMMDRLDAAFQTQKQFTANAAHELRTPLAVMQTNLEVFLKKEGAYRGNGSGDDVAAKDVSRAEYDKVITQSLVQTERLSALVNSLLELLTLHTVPRNDSVELYCMAEEILYDLEPIAEKKNIKLSLTGSSATIIGNDGLIYRAIYNLVENGIKYNHEGGFVEVNVSDGRVTVRDSGTGIPKELWDKIFEPFYRVDKARSRTMGGAGLGLALVADIAAVHDGRVSVVDSDESGTRIVLDFGQDLSL